MPFKKVHNDIQGFRIGFLYIYGGYGLNQNHDLGFDYLFKFVELCNYERTNIQLKCKKNDERVGFNYAFMAMLNLDPKSTYSKKDSIIGNKYLKLCNLTTAKKMCLYF